MKLTLLEELEFFITKCIKLSKVFNERLWFTYQPCYGIL